jgi:hypothetical protein
MFTYLRELGLEVTDEQIHEVTYTCSFENSQTIGSFMVLNMRRH